MDGLKYLGRLKRAIVIGIGGYALHLKLNKILNTS